jgi:hypothetical protein
VCKGQQQGIVCYLLNHHHHHLTFHHYYLSSYVTTFSTKMQNLPAETIDSIVGFIELKELSRYSALSTYFQSAVERRTHESITLKSTELDSFTKIFSSSRRRAILSNLLYQVILPKYDHRYYDRYERKSDRNANNRVYTEAIKSLFRLLSAWQDDSNSSQLKDGFNPRGIALEIRAYSPSDKPHRSDEDGAIRLVSPGGDCDLEHRRYKRSFLRVLETENIPAVSFIKSFSIFTWEEGDVRFVEPSTVASLAGLMPGLERFDWTLPDNEKYKQFAEARQERRYRKVFNLLNL